MIIKDSIRFVIASIAMVLFVLFGCSTRTAYAETGTVTPEMSKTIKAVEGEEDTYELSLSMQTTSEIINQTAPLDVIFIADLSGSMDYKTSGGSTRLKDLKKALTADGGLIESVLSNSENRLAIVSFAGDNDYSGGYLKWNAKKYDDADKVIGWSDKGDIDKVKQATEGMAIDEKRDDTNIGAGLRKAEELLEEATSDSERYNAKKVIVLLTDGVGNVYYDEDGYSHNYQRNDTLITNSLESEVEKLKAHKLDGFYSIAFADTTAISSLTTIQNAWKDSLADENNKVFLAKDTAELINRFKEIVNSIKTLMFQNVVITDILSDWVELISGEASNFSMVKEKYDNDGKLTASEKLTEGFTIEITTTEGDKTQVRAIFDNNYVFDDCCTYILKFKVRISQKGYDKFADTGCATLPSNDNATVSYTYDGITQEVEFNVPTIDSVTLKIPITVKWDMLTGGEIPKDSVTVELFQDSGENSYRKEDVTGDEWTSSFTSIAKGKHTYTVKAPDITGFTKTVENVGTEAKPEFVVTYVQLPSLTISKTLIVDEKEVKADDDEDGFKMTVTLKDQDNRALTGKQGGYTFKNGQTTVSVPAGKSVTLSYLPRGTQYTVEETDESSAGYDVAYTDNNDGTLNKSDQKVTVTNTKLPSLTISKTVTGDYGDKGREFAFTITLTTKDDSNVSGEFTMTKGDDTEKITFSNGTATVTLKHDESVVIKDLPLGASYTVEETADSRSGYIVSYNDSTTDKATGTLTKSARVDVVNTMTEITSTGGNSSHGSAVKLGVIGGLAVLVALALVARKVKKDDL